MTCYLSRKTAKTLLYTHTQGYITLDNYIIAIARIGIPKVHLWATKCVTKKPQSATKTLFSAKHRVFTAKIYPKK